MKVIAITVAVVLYISSLIGGFSCNSTPDGTVKLYTTVPVDIISEIEIAFENEYPSIDLEIFRGGTDKLEDAQRLVNGDISADIVWVADFTAAEIFKEEGILLKYRPPEADALLDCLMDDDNTYYGARLLNMVVAYNTLTVSQKPSDYFDLLDPVYHGRVGHSRPERSGAFLYFAGTLLHDPDYGTDYFKELAAADPLIQTNTQITDSIVSGDLDIGITIDFTVRKVLKDNPDAPIDIVYPESGVVMIPSPIAICKDARNLEGAKIFERYILSSAGQTLLRDIAGVVPVRLDVIPPEGITTITKLKVILSDQKWIKEHRDEIVTEFVEYFGMKGINP
ncbi:MAG: extracellular solute-binding protein [Dehalococcoidales bacterium]|nr:extracellular solute-binding protein [Dehalococcoidales bacterium]